MRIGIPTDGDQGLAAAVAGHLGRAPFYTVVDTESGEVTVLANAPHGEGGCKPAGALVGHRVEAVLCAGAGRGAVAALEAAGMRVLLTRSATVAEAVATVRNGTALAFPAAEVCAGSGCSCHH